MSSCLTTEKRAFQTSVAPSSGLDARAAAIVMRCIKNVSRSGRSILVTIHQPSIEIFETFDSLVLLQRGGRVRPYCLPTRDFQSMICSPAYKDLAGTAKRLCTAGQHSTVHTTAVEAVLLSKCKHGPRPLRRHPASAACRCCALAEILEWQGFLHAALFGLGHTNSNSCCSATGGCHDLFTVLLVTST